MEKISNSFWEVTYRQNIARMIGVCCRYTQNRETAEDLAHDAFLIAIDKVSSFENRGPFEAWLRRIVINVALQYLRDQKKNQKSDIDHIEFPAFNEMLEELPSNESGTFSEAELLATIGRLPEHHRLVFNLYVIDNFTHVQIATQLGISEGTSKSHLARARKKLRELLNQQLNENKERKRVLLLLFIPYQFWDIDLLVSRNLNGLEIPPLKNHPTARIDSGNSRLPISHSNNTSHLSLKTGISVIAGTAIFLTISNLYINPSHQLSPKSVISSVTLSRPQDMPEKSRGNLFSGSTATIAQNPILVEKTKNEEPMKNLKTLGGLLIAGLALDSAAMPKELPVSIKNQQIATIHVPESSRSIESIQPSEKSKDKLLTGTFYASKLFWSETNSQLFLLGDDVRVDLNTQKFKGGGKFSFINHLNFVVVDGTQMKLNETIRLENKRYRLNELNESEGFKKYGEKGRYGVVEITIAE